MIYLLLRFQSTPSQRGRLTPPIRTIAPLYFNPRPRKEGDLYRLLTIFVAEEFQSTPSQRGRHSAKTWQRNKQSISIHALAKRATGTASRASISGCISIHALAKRATANLYNDYLYFEAKYHISDIFPL